MGGRKLYKRYTFFQAHEEKLQEMEEKRSDEVEVAKETYEKREEKKKS